MVGVGRGENLSMGIHFMRMPITALCLFEKNMACPTAVFNFSLGHFSTNINCFQEKQVVSNIFLQTWSLFKLQGTFFKNHCDPLHYCSWCLHSSHRPNGLYFNAMLCVGRKKWSQNWRNSPGRLCTGRSRCCLAHAHFIPSFYLSKSFRACLPTHQCNRVHSRNLQNSDSVHTVKMKQRGKNLLYWMNTCHFPRDAFCCE